MNFKKLYYSMMFCFLLVFATAGIACAASSPIFDVKASSVNIRLGPGLAYPVVNTQPIGADLPNLSMGQTHSDGYYWLRFYYPDINAGQYQTGINGYAVWYTDSGTYYTNYASYGAKVITHNTFYDYYDYNLSSLCTMYAHHYGDIAWAYDMSCSGYQYETGYPNAWRVSENNNGYSTLYYGNGWLMNAGSNFGSY